MKKIDTILERINAFNQAHGGGVIIKHIRGGYSLFDEDDGSPVARLRPTGNADEVEILWWSHRDKWENIGEFGGVILPLSEALEYIAEDPDGCFWF
jgi:hypothetical protein